MESLGSLEAFLSGENEYYSGKAFIQWIEEKIIQQNDDQIFEIIMQSSNIKDEKLMKEYGKSLVSKVTNWISVRKGGQ